MNCDCGATSAPLWRSEDPPCGRCHPQHNMRHIPTRRFRPTTEPCFLCAARCTPPAPAHRPGTPACCRPFGRVFEPPPRPQGIWVVPTPAVTDSKWPLQSGAAAKKLHNPVPWAANDSCIHFCDLEGQLWAVRSCGHAGGARIRRGPGGTCWHLPLAMCVFCEAGARGGATPRNGDEHTPQGSLLACRTPWPDRGCPPIGVCAI